MATHEPAVDRLRENEYDPVVSDFARADAAGAGYYLLAKVKAIDRDMSVIIYSGTSVDTVADAKTRGAFGQTNRSWELFNMTIDVIRKGAAVCRNKHRRRCRCLESRATR